MEMISKEYLLKAFGAFNDEEHAPEGWMSAMKTAREIVEDAPSVDAVEVVRCKDCIYYEELNNNEYYCDAIYRDLHGDDEGVDFEPPQDYFCAYGQRRESDG